MREYLNPSAARKLWFGFAIVAAYGSIYPANFQTHAFDSSAIRAFLGSCCGRPHSGDVLGNVILYIPFGFLGMLAANRATSNALRLGYVCILGVLFALVLQFAQVYLPSRDANLQDVAWNFLGIVGGLLIGLSVRSYVLRASRISHQILLIPWILITAWLIYRLIPFVPSIDFQGIKDSLKPLLLDPKLIPINIVHDTVAWSLIAYFLRYGQRSITLDAYLPLLMLVTFCLEVLIVANVLSASNIVGAGLAIILWWGVLRHIAWRERVLALLLFSMLVFVGLAPFILQPEATSFNWLPFHGFLGGSMYINSQAACEKTFFYGALVYLLWKGGFGTLPGTVIAAAGVAVIEFAQTRFIGHTPEISDPILVGLAALALFALKDDEGPSRNGARPTGVQHSSPESLGLDSMPIGAQGRLVNEDIDLRSDQVDFLRHLSERLDVSTSRTIRRIVDEVIQDARQRRESGREDALDITIAPSADRGRIGGKLTSYNVRLREDQVELLTALGQRVGANLSVSTRNLIDRFIANLGEDA